MKHYANDNPHSRNGVRSKTLVTDQGDISIEVNRGIRILRSPLSWCASINGGEPIIDETIMFLVAHGMTTGEISAHFQ